MVSWGSEGEEASPLLEVVTPEEHGVRGIKVSARILRSCCDETDSFLRTLEHFSACFTRALMCKHTSSWYFLSSSATSLCAFSHSSFSFSCSRWYFSCYRGNRRGKNSREPQLKTLWRCVHFSKKKTRSINRLKKKTLKGFLVWKSDIKTLLYASK